MVFFPVLPGCARVPAVDWLAGLADIGAMRAAGSELRAEMAVRWWQLFSLGLAR